MTKLLITGASGFLGRAFLHVQGARDWEVHATCLRCPTLALPKAPVWHRVDLLDFAATERLIAQIQPELLLHLAWTTSPGAYWTSDENLAWSAATLALARAFYRHGGRRFVVAGSSAEYDWGGSQPLNEFSTPLKPTSIYGTCKNATREMLEAFTESRGFSMAWGRIFNLFGPYENPARLIPKTIRSILQREPVPLDGAQNQADFLHVEDAAEAFLQLLNTDATGPFNIASGSAISIQTLALTIAQLLDAEDLVSFDRPQAPPFSFRSVTASIHKLQSQTHWRPVVSLKSRLESTCEWWKNQPSNPLPL